MKVFLIFGLTLLFNLSLNLPSYPGEIYKWIDENGVTHFTQDFGNIPEKYRARVKNKYWAEEKPAQVPQERQSQEKEKIGWHLEESLNDPKAQKMVYSPELCSERNRHISKAQETFPNEKNITKAWSMYYEKYMTEDERKRIPLYVSTNTDPCRKENINSGEGAKQPLKNSQASVAGAPNQNPGEYRPGGSVMSPSTGRIYQPQGGYPSTVPSQPKAVVNPRLPTMPYRSGSSPKNPSTREFYRR